VNTASIHKILSLLTESTGTANTVNTEASVSQQNTFCAGAQEISVTAPVMAVTHWMNIVNSGVGKSLSHLLLLFEHYKDTKQEFQNPLLYLIRTQMAFSTLLYSFFFGDSPASKYYVPTFRNTLFHLHRWCKQLHPLPRSTATCVCVCA
jgi:hypothetical protein